MTIPEIIERKREGLEHTRTELETLILGFVRGEVPDYQIAAWLMAVYLRGMTPQETTALTQVMAASGDQLDLSSLERTTDKHSTGGVGDKTSLVLTPMLAACGVTVAWWGKARTSHPPTASCTPCAMSRRPCPAFP
jgi:pyrimidine-nucleoside phosphorylase